MLDRNYAILGWAKFCCCRFVISGSKAISIRYSAFLSIHACSSLGMALRQLCRDRDLHAVAVAFCSSCERGMLLRHERHGRPRADWVGRQKREERAKRRVYMYLFKLCCNIYNLLSHLLSLTSRSVSGGSCSYVSFQRKCFSHLVDAYAYASSGH